MNLKINPAQPALAQWFQPAIWARVNRSNVRKILAEFSHEKLFHPECTGGKAGLKQYVLYTDKPGVRYTFIARLRSLDHWDIDEPSLQKFLNDKMVPLDALEFIIELKGILGLTREHLTPYLDELTSSMRMECVRIQAPDMTSRELATASALKIESALVVTQPRLIVRDVKTDINEEALATFSHGSGRTFSLIWFAAHRSCLQFYSLDEAGYRHFLTQEVGEDTLNCFNELLASKSLNPQDYLPISVHPWHWKNKFISLFGNALAHAKLVYLGHGFDNFYAQLGGLTLSNASRLERPHIQTTLSVSRRKLPLHFRAQGAPALDQWVHEVVSTDPYLKERAFTILRELVQVSFRAPTNPDDSASDRLDERLLTNIYSQTPVPLARSHEQLLNMRALLHRDRDGVPLVREFIEHSPLESKAWLRSFLRCYLQPLLHCLYAHEMAFLHPVDNTVLCLAGGVPVRAFMKSASDGMVLYGSPKSIPSLAASALNKIPNRDRLDTIFSEIFDGHFRFLSQILSESELLSEDEFWLLTAQVIVEYQHSHPSLNKYFVRYDLFAETVSVSFPNRRQLPDHGDATHSEETEETRADYPAAGTLLNPLAKHYSWARASKVRTPTRKKKGASRRNAFLT